MSTQVLTDVAIYTDGYDLSGDHNAVALNYSAEMLDDTTFGSGGTRSRKGGLKVIGFSGEGFWNGGAGLQDIVHFEKIGVANVPVTLAPAGEALGNPAYFFRCNHGSYTVGAEVGQILPFSVTAEGSGGVGVVRGELMHVGSETTTGNKAAKVQLGAVAAGQSVYAAIHVLSVSGTNPTLDVLVRSDADSSAGSETTRITFSEASAIGSEWMSTAGAITDTWWDVSWTIGGTDTPTFEFVVVVGII